jgi:hypothetical protein
MPAGPVEGATTGRAAGARTSTSVPLVMSSEAAHILAVRELGRLRRASS